MAERYDVLVVGVGGVGSAATYRLADRGLDVLGLERYDVPHARGSSHGDTRIIRRVQHKDPRYVPLVERAYDLWHELEAETGRDLLYETGSVHAGPADSEFLADCVDACESGDVAYDLLAAEELNERFPGYDLPPEYRALYQPDGGFLAVERCTVAHVEAAHDAGATVRAREPVLSIEETADGVRVRTEKGRYEADELLVTAGAWCRELLPELVSAVVPVRAVMAWFRPERPERFTPDRFPVFLLRDGTESGYGFPRFERPGVKVGLSEPTPAVDPGEMDPEPTAAEERLHRRFVERHFPAAAGPTMRLSTCLWTMTDDEDFLLGRPEGYDSVTVGAGFSGHGFKFASALGEVLAGLTVDGETAHDVDFLDVNRVT